MASVAVYKQLERYLNLRFLLRNISVCKNVDFNTKSSCYCTTSNPSNDGFLNGDKTIEDHYLNPDVQHILKKIAGLNYEKVFRPIKETLEPPEYKFVTDKELQKLQTSAHRRALEKLQMPPVMQPRKPINEIIAKNPEVQGCETHRIVFTDISPNSNQRDRVIVVREPNGILRQATWEERFRMNQIFFPMPGRKLTMPTLFREDKLQDLLESESYLFVLDYACVQFEPDDPEYIRVTHTTYDHINKMKKFDEIRSTRHFGPLAFYLAYSNKIEKLLIDMLERELTEDAIDLIKLMCILHPEIKKNLNLEQNEIDVIKDFITGNTSVYKAVLELAFQTFCEVHKHEMKSETTA